MTLAHYIDPRSDLRQRVRWYLGDTDTTSNEQVVDPLVTDVEIEFALGENSNNVIKAAAFCARYASMKLLRGDVYAVKLLDFSATSGGNMSAKDLSDKYLELATRLESESHPPGIYAGGISIADKETTAANSDRVAPFFHRNMHDYPGN